MSWFVRWRISSEGPTDVFVTGAELKEDGSTVATLVIEFLAGDAVTADPASGSFGIEPDDEAVFQAEFDPSAITDLAELEVKLDFATTSVTIGHLFSVDVFYSVR